MDAEFELLATPEETTELMEVLVRDCGCGCTFADDTLDSPTRECAALRAFEDRRFVLGLMFTRRLRRQLEAEEWLRTPRGKRSPLAFSPLAPKNW